MTTQAKPDTETRQAIALAKWRIFIKDPKNRLQYNWVIEAEYVREKFIKTFEKTKFRKPWKKDFFESMKTAERISQKQKDLMIKWMAYKRVSVKTFVDREEIEWRKKELLGEETQDIVLTPEQIESARRSIRNRVRG